jgi:hypothetical protein
VSRPAVPSCLAWAGALGHRWIVVTRIGDAAWRVGCETDEGSRAAFWHDAAIDQGAEAMIFRRRGGFGKRRAGTSLAARWEKVRPSLASIS